jgi:hypothetical protein
MSPNLSEDMDHRQACDDDTVFHTVMHVAESFGPLVKTPPPNTPNTPPPPAATRPIAAE